MTLAARGRGVDAQVGEETTFRRNPGKHAGGEAFLPSPSHRLVRGPDEDSGVTIKGHANLFSRAHRFQHAFHHRPVDLHPRPSRPIKVHHGLGPGVLASNPFFREGIADHEEEPLGFSNPAMGLQGGLEWGLDTGADESQGSSACWRDLSGFPLDHQSSWSGGRKCTKGTRIFAATFR